MGAPVAGKYRLINLAYMPTYNPNINHPKKGRRIKVEPIREPKDIRSIDQLLESRAQDYLLFVMGINNGLRAGDFLKFRVADPQTGNASLA
jgi:integrase